MKITRKDLRVLIESIILEQNQGDIDYENEKKQLDAKKVKSDLMGKKSQILEQLASSFNEALRGGADTSYLAGVLAGVGDGAADALDIIISPISPAAGTFFYDNVSDFSEYFEAGTDEELFEKTMAMVAGLAENMNSTLGNVMNSVANEYKRLFNRELLTDIRGDFNQNEINELERKFKGFKAAIKYKG
jgi:hypothetical protein